MSGPPTRDIARTAAAAPSWRRCPSRVWVYDAERRLVLTNDAAFAFAGLRPGGRCRSARRSANSLRLFAYRGVYGAGRPGGAGGAAAAARPHPATRAGCCAAPTARCHEVHSGPLPGGGSFSVAADVSRHQARHRGGRRTGAAARGGDGAAAQRPRRVRPGAPAGAEQPGLRGADRPAARRAPPRHAARRGHARHSPAAATSPTPTRTSSSPSASPSTARAPIPGSASGRTAQVAQPHQPAGARAAASWWRSPTSPAPAAPRTRRAAAPRCSTASWRRCRTAWWCSAPTAAWRW